MTRKSFSQFAQEACAHNGVATLVTPDIRAVIYVEPRGHGAVLDYLALLPDGRFRHGQVTIHGKGTHVPGPAVHPHPGPLDANALAAALRRAIDGRDARGAARETRRPFSICGWTPWEAPRGPGMALYLGMAEDRVLPWLDLTPAEQVGGFNAAWAFALAGHVTPEQVDAAEAFSGIHAFDPAAFDEACGLTLAGARCRSFARDNAAVALAVLSHPPSRALVAAGAPLPDVLDALPRDEPGLRPAYGNRKARRAAVARISGAHAAELGHEPVADLVLAALESLPPEWAPRTDGDMEAFARLCRGAVHSYAVRLPGGVVPDWWRQPFAGSCGRWTAFAKRVVDAGAAGGWKVQPDTLLEIAAERRAFLVEDVLSPLAAAYGSSGLRALSDLPGTWMGSLRATARSALHDFAHHALTEGMALPAVAAQGLRHFEARDAIAGVCRRFPKAGPSEAGGDVWFRTPDNEVPPGVIHLTRAKQAYDAGAPGAIEAMVAAWRPVLPRRLRPMSVRDLATALDAEAARFLLALPNG